MMVSSRIKKQMVKEFILFQMVGGIRAISRIINITVKEYFL